IPTAFKPVEMLKRSAPDCAAAILQQHVRGTRGAVFIFGNDDREHGSGSKFLVREYHARGWLALRIKEYQAAICGNPNLTAARFQKIIDRRVRQSLIDSIVRKGVSIETR